MTHKLLRTIEKNRNSKNLFWSLLVYVKDVAWKLKNTIKTSFEKRNDRKENFKIADDCYNEYAKSGLSLWGHMDFRRTLDEYGKLKIPENITNIKLDVGMSQSAPNSMIWLTTLSDRLVFGFEPNPENFRKLMTTEKIKKYLNTRFFVFQLAIDYGEPSIKSFRMTKKDAGTSSLYNPTRLEVKKTIKVLTISLSDFLSLVPWNTIPYIEHLKVDTQGNDLRVIQSAGKYLSERIVFITAECSTDGHYEYSHTENELDDFMRKSGFDFVEGSKKGYDKTYINKKFIHLMHSLDYSTQ